jgi:DNA-binding MarR family transcriptional regulator
MPTISADKKKSVDFSIKAAWLAISKMYNYIGNDFDISHSTGFVLLNIDKEQGTPATKIAPLLGMEARSLTRMLKAMEEKKLIYRKADQHDKRKVIIFLTDEGRKKRELAKQSVKYFHKKVEERLTQEQLDTFHYVVDQIHYAIDHLNEKEAEKEILGKAEEALQGVQFERHRQTGSNNQP